MTADILKDQNTQKIRISFQLDYTNSLQLFEDLFVKQTNLQQLSDNEEGNSDRAVPSRRKDT